MTQSAADTLAADPPAELTVEVKAGDPPADSNPSRVGSVERGFAEILCELVGTDRVAPESHFFDDLGADSMVMARFCARVRRNAGLPSVSMKDIYRNPTVSSLALALTPAAEDDARVSEATPGPPSPGAVTTDESGRPAASPGQVPLHLAQGPQPGAVEAAAAVSGHAVEHDSGWPDADEAPASQRVARTGEQARTVSYVLCGIAQFALFAGYSSLVGWVMVRGYEWISAGAGLLGVYLRSVAAGGGLFLTAAILPVLVKWLLIGRWRPRQIEIWSLAYLRFWVVKTLVRANPAVLVLSGSPLYVLYLRALGAKIGKRVVILSNKVPVCTDLITIGDDTVIRKEATLLGYRAVAQRIQVGGVTIGRDAFVGDKSVLDIDTSIGHGGQLGHTSSLYRGQHVPAGQTWHGSPAVPATLDYDDVPPRRCGSWRRATYAVTSLLPLFLLYLPVAQGAGYAVLFKIPALAGPLLPSAGVGMRAALEEALVVSIVSFFSLIVVGLVMAFAIPRLLSLFLVPERVYPLYGFHYGIQRAVARMTNVPFFTHLFGDSSYIVHYLRALGYKFGKVKQTGSNFGMAVSHDTPYLSTIGAGTMVADGLHMMNARYSTSSFCLSRVKIGAHSFLGNMIAYPPGGRVGDNCLLATKVMVPLDGEIREGVGLLGSPCFEIPRSVSRDSRFDHLATGRRFRRQLAAKNRYNRRTMAVFLFLRWSHMFLLALIGMIGVNLYDVWGHAGVAVISLMVSVLGSVAYFAFVERALARFRRLQPQYCSIYESYFWWHERYWKTVGMIYLHIFDGTPFKSMVWRALGVRVGRRLFDDGGSITERTLATIGDNCTLNPGSILQCHSQEDGTFKSDHIVIGSGCTLGVGAFVHYGVTMGDDSHLACDSFLMKGEDVPAGAYWGGNPAAPRAHEDAWAPVRRGTTSALDADGASVTRLVA